MRARTSRNDAGMDLFPFMAVLICTVGALIMLLVVMVQQAQVKANAPRDTQLAQQRQQQLEFDAKQQSQKEELAEHERQKQLAADQQYKVDEFKWKAELLRSSYDTAVGQVTDQRLALSHLESHSRELSDKAAAMQAEADLIAAAAKDQDAQDAASEESIHEITSAIELAKEELSQSKDKLKNLDPKYVLIPYAGPSGTDRRPIYIECLADRVILQPENVTLIGEDFLAPLNAENPLARALRAKREFLHDNGLMSHESEPYPLLVVRPGAAATYAAARSAMQAWESEFGYELVEADVKLDYTEADPRLKQLLEDVVLDTRGRRRMMRSMQTRSKPRRRERLRPSASGGFESVGGGDESFNVNEPESFDDQLPFKTKQDGRFANQGAGNRARRRNASDGAGAGNGGGSGQSAGESAAEFRGEQGAPLGPQIGNRFDSGNSGAGNSGSGDFGSGGAGDNQLQFTSPGGPADTFEQFGGQRGSGSGGQQGGVGGSDADGTSATGQDGQEQASGSARMSRASRNRRGNPFRAGVSGSGGDANRAGAGGSSAEATGSGGQGTTGSGGSGSAGAKSGSTSVGSQFGSPPASLAESRGSGWATANMQHDAVGIQRPIYVVCEQDSLALLPERGTTQELRVFRHHGRIDTVLDAFVGSVQDRLEGWGIAGQGIYWKPVLQIKVNKNSDATYDRLMHLLDDSGIEVTREP